MDPYYQDDTVTLWHGDCRAVLPTLDDASMHAIVTDPPYELAFMGRKWDASGVAFDPAVWAECLRVLKPGGHLLAFGGSRTWHRLAAAIEDAGFDIRDSIAWLYGSGFPKSLDVSKAIDKAAGAEREVVGARITGNAKQRTSRTGEFAAGGHGGTQLVDVTAPATPDAASWQGWGTALKPAFEPVVVARKPLTGTVAATVLTHGTGALNVDACRVGDELITAHGGGVNGSGRTYGAGAGIPALPAGSNPHAGRWPTNVVLDQHTAAELDKQAGDRPVIGGERVLRRGLTTGLSIGSADTYNAAAPHEAVAGYGDTGGASRFFPVFRYEAKAPTTERPRDGDTAHPTVKPLDLMRWLVRLVTPPGGTVLDPFAGSGTTAEACVIEGFRCVTVEREPDYLPLIVARLTKPLEPVLDLGALA